MARDRGGGGGRVLRRYGVEIDWAGGGCGGAKKTFGSFFQRI